MEETATSHTDWWQRHENIVVGRDAIRFDLYVRSVGRGLGPHRRHTSIVDRIERLDRRDVVDAASVTVWGDSVCVSECCSNVDAADAIRERVAAFREWAGEKRHVSLSLPRRVVDSAILEESHEVIDLPTACLAVSSGTELEGVFPASIGDDEWTIGTYLDWFERTRTAADHKAIADA